MLLWLGQRPILKGSPSVLESLRTKTRRLPGPKVIKRKWPEFVIDETRVITSLAWSFTAFYPLT